MNYFTALASSPVFEFPYSGHQTHGGLNLDNDINALLGGITPAIDGHTYNQTPSITLQCVPQVNTGVIGNTTVYQVPEDMPIDMILEKLGVNPHTLQGSHGISNYYRTTFQPMELLLPSHYPSHRRRLVCREVSDTDDEGYHRRPSDHHRRHSSGPWRNESQNSPLNLHNVLSRVWEKAERGSRNVQPSQSTPNLNSQWQAMRNSNPSPPPNPSMNNMWQTMRNAPTPIPPNNQSAVNRVWQRADYASGLQPNPSSNLFNPMPPSFPNREATQNFNAIRNLPYGVNAAPSPPPFQNREATQNFNAIRNLPYGINTGSSPPPFQNREATQNFNAIRNLPYGINTGSSPQPFQNREAAQNFNAIRNLPFGINTPPSPPPPNSAINNFFAARNVPGGINQPNPAIANVWNKADYAAQQGPPMINVPWNQGQSPSPPLPMNNMWNRMQQGASGPSYPTSPMSPFQRGPVNGPAPASFAGLLSQAHRRGLPYSGAS